MLQAINKVTMLKSCSISVPLLKSLTHYHVSYFHSTSLILKGSQHPFERKSKKILQQQQNLVDKIDFSNQFEVLSDVVTPHWRISYEEELAIKQKLCNDVVNEVLSRIGSNPNKSGRRFSVDNFIASPVRDAYRSKDEFSMWTGLNGEHKTIGFFIGSPAVGKVFCVPATEIKCIKESHKEIAQLYQNFTRLSPLPASYQLYDGGFWRNIFVRSNEAGDHLAIIITNRGNYTLEEIAEQEGLMKDYFSQHAPSLALFHQSCLHVKCTRDQAPINHLSGNSHLTDTLSDLVIRTSPDSFCQNNKQAAQLLYNVVLDMAKPKHFTTLLDLYCGTGALSLLASKYVRGCVGIEEVKMAVEDAKYNAERNNITNCSFVSGKVELNLAKVLKRLEFSSDIVAVLNPGRTGAVEGVISLLRQNPNINKVVYVSCKPDNPLTMKNFVQLCERVAHNVKPFHLVQATPVDLFPYTRHYELALSFARC